jgi:hypothetical protein
MAATRRRFTWRWRGEDATLLAAQVRGVFGVFCDEWPTWYVEPKVSGEAYGIVEASITVVSRDQWWVQKRARRLLAALARHTDVPVLQADEETVRLPPHEHRGAEYRKVTDGR